MAIKILVTVLSAGVAAEFFGYWIHVLLHSNKVEFLSRNHMIHHLSLYGPEKPLRTDVYVESIGGRTSLLGVGLEWVVPIGLILGGLAGIFHFLGVTAPYQALFVAVALGWGFFMFSYIHDAMHVKNFWMEKSPVFGRWFLNARKKHDVHHRTLSDDGRMIVNFGICFFLFDRLFRSFQKEQTVFNRKGFQAALTRYAFIFKDQPSA